MEKNDELSRSTPVENMRVENDSLKSKLAAEFGMKMSECSDLPEEIENEWLNNIYEFETKFKNSKRIKIYDAIGRPSIRKADDMTDEEITDELNRIIDLMQKRSLILDFISEYDDKTKYIFLTDEFMEKEIDDIQIKGMKTCFIYEEFHPNHEHDIRKLTEDFFRFLLKADWNEDHLEYHLSECIRYGQKLLERDKFTGILHSFRESAKPVGLELLEIYKADFNLEDNTGSAHGEISYSVSQEGDISAHISGLFTLNFIYNDYFWVINEMTFPLFD